MVHPCTCDTLPLDNSKIHLYPALLYITISTKITNPLVNGSNQGASSWPTHHEWVWFKLEWKASCTSGLAWTECRCTVLVVHQELKLMPLKVQQSNYWDVLIKLDSPVEMEWVAQKLIRVEWWMWFPCHIKCILCSDKDELWEFGGDWCPLGRCWIVILVKEGAGNPHRCHRWAPSKINMGFPSSLRPSRVARISQHWGFRGPLVWPSSVALTLPFKKG